MRETCYDKTTRYNLVVFFIVYPSIFFQRFFLDDSLSEVVPFFSVCEHIVPKDSWNFVGSFFVYLRVRVFFRYSQESVLKKCFSSAPPIIEPWHASSDGFFFSYNFTLIKTNISLPKTLLKRICSSSKGGIYIYIFIYTYYFLGR